MRLICQPVLFLSLAANAAAASNDLSIEPNLGQSGTEVRYLARTPRGSVFFLDHELVLRGPGEVRLEMLGAKRSARFEALEPRAGTTSYSVGRDQSKWAQDVPGYSRLVQREVYRGVDAIYYGSSAGIEYDFVVAPYSDPLQIRFAIRGADRVRIDSKGDLLVQTPSGLMRQRRPLLYQVSASGTRQIRTGGFRQLGRYTIGFTVGRYDESRPLTIDPVIESSTYFGGSGDDAIVASNGTMSVGMTTSVEFPVASGRRGGRDILISGVNGNTFVYGGSGDDVVTAAYMPEQFTFRNGSSMLVVVGYTNSPDLPTDISYNPLIPLSNPRNVAWQRDYGGGASDAFVLAIVNRRTLTSSFTPFLSYMGGSGNDRATGVSASREYSSSFQVIGSTDQPGFPLQGSTQVQTVGVGGGVDGFLASGSFSLGAELFSITYFGGSGDDRPLGIQFGENASVITGETASTDFPLTSSLNSIGGGANDAFVLETGYDLTGLVLRNSTVFGGSGEDRGVQVAILPNGNIVVGGVTSSRDFPILNPLQSTYGGGPSDVFFVQFTPDLSKLISSSYYGGSGADETDSPDHRSIRQYVCRRLHHLN